MSTILLLLLDGSTGGSSPPPATGDARNGIGPWGGFMWGGSVPVLGSTVVIVTPSSVILSNGGKATVVLTTATVEANFAVLTTSGRTYFWQGNGAVTDFWIKRGDTLPIVSGYLVGADGARPNLTGATVLAKMRNARTGAVVFSTAATITDAPNAGISYSWASGDTTNTLEGQLEFEVTFPSTKVESFPNPGFISVHITSDVS